MQTHIKLAGLKESTISSSTLSEQLFQTRPSTEILLEKPVMTQKTDNGKRVMVIVKESELGSRYRTRTEDIYLILSEVWFGVNERVV